MAQGVGFDAGSGDETPDRGADRLFARGSEDGDEDERVISWTAEGPGAPGDLGAESLIDPPRRLSNSDNATRQV